MEKPKVEVKICPPEVAASMPQVLYSYFEKLAASNGMRVGDYMAGIMEQAKGSEDVLGWDEFPTEARRLLVLYKFAFADSLSRAEAMHHLSQ